MTAHDIATALDARKSGPSSWWARCPAHQDRKPSLEITDAGDKVLVRCWSGCTQQAVISALRSQGLWPDPPPLTQEQKREWARAVRQPRLLAKRIEAWRMGAGMRLKDEKIDGEARGDLEYLARAARELYLLQLAGPAELARMYHESDPVLRAEDEAAGRRWRDLCESLILQVVSMPEGQHEFR